MFGWHYTVHIMEERNDGKIYWCYTTQTNTLQKAYRAIENVLPKMKNPPQAIAIYKDWNKRTIPTTPFRWGGNMSFHEVDFYL